MPDVSDLLHAAERGNPPLWHGRETVPQRKTAGGDFQKLLAELENKSP
jgi:hypothetical protein